MHVSIIVPTYNRAALLGDTLQSVVAQTYPHWECLVVDDGSTDETPAVVRPFGPRVRYIRQRNAGPAVARDRGAAEAMGEGLLFLDSDDVLLPNALAQLVEALRQTPEAGIAYGGFSVMHADGRPGLLAEAPRLPQSVKNDGGSPVSYGLTGDGQILPALLQHDAVLMGATLLRRSVFERIGGFDSSLNYMEHWELFLRAAHRGVLFAATREPAIRVRMHENNLSRDFEGMLQQRLALIDAYLPSDHPAADRIRDAARSNAWAVLGTCLCAVGHVEQGLRHLRQALHHRPLTETAYDTITAPICDAAVGAPDPYRRIGSLLARLGPSPHARPLKHVIHSRFFRVLAQRVSSSGGARSRVQAAGLLGRSGWHLGCAVGLRPELGGTYIRRLARRLRVS
jgi:hypothetical protein